MYIIQQLFPCQIRKNEVGGARGTYGRGNKCTVVDGKRKAMRLLRIYSYIFEGNIKMILKK
jgi:hypothetical protein